MKPRTRLPLGVSILAAVLGVLLLALAGPGRAAPGTTRQQAVRKALDFLLPDAVSWTSTNQCAGCHRAAAALTALSASLATGHPVDRGDFNGAGYLAKWIAAEQQPDGRWTNQGQLEQAKTSYAMLGLAAYDAAVSDRFTPALLRGADYLLTSQLADGRWPHADYLNPPTVAGDLDVTARDMLGVRQALERAQGTPREPRLWQSLDRAAAWIRSLGAEAIAAGSGNGGLAWAILGLCAADVPSTDPELVALRDRLLAAVSTQGGRGWGSVPDAAPDPFHTGLALYALRRIGLAPQEVPALAAGIDWLAETLEETEEDGSWSTPLLQTRGTATALALLGLQSFGDLGVDADVVGPRDFVFQAAAGASQSHNFTLTVRNTSAFAEDSYDLALQGAFPGWRGSLIPQGPITLQPGESRGVELRVVVPAGQPPSLVVPWTLRATSRTAPTVTATAIVFARTDPAPPAAGDATRTIVASGPGTSVTIGRESVRLSAFTYAPGTGELLFGPGAGTVTFLVNGAAVGSDQDPDGDGLFAFDWVPPDCNVAGEYALRAVYWGADLPGEADLLGSEDAGTITLVPPPPHSDLVVLAVKPERARRARRAVPVKVKGAGFMPGATLDFGPGITATVGEVSSHVIEAQLDIAFEAELSTRDVTVTLPDGASAVGEQLFTVLPADPPALESLTPAKGARTQTVRLTVAGQGLFPGAHADLGPGITITGETVTPKGGELSGQLLTFDAAISPTADLGPRDITVTNPDGQSARLSAAFTVLASAPQLVVTPTRLTLSAKLRKTSKPRTFRIENPGFQPLIGKISRPKSTAFRITPKTLTFTLQPGQSLTYSVTYTPAGTRALADTVVVSANDPQNKKVTITLTGKTTR
jgi:hypothetical protein